jgi:uncharacterized protein (DUF2267 family)
MHYAEFIDRVAQQANLTHDRAEALTAATLGTLAERITGGEAKDLAAQLPTELQEPLAGVREAAEAFSFDEFQHRVRARARLDDGEAIADGVRAVFAILGLAVTSGELDDVVSHLPRECRDALGVTG